MTLGIIDVIRNWRALSGSRSAEAKRRCFSVSDVCNVCWLSLCPVIRDVSHLYLGTRTAAVSRAVQRHKISGVWNVANPPIRAIDRDYQYTLCSWWVAECEFLIFFLSQLCTLKCYDCDAGSIVAKISITPRKYESKWRKKKQWKIGIV